MTAIRIHKQIDSETLHLPEIRPLIGKQVEIIVIEENPVEPGRASNGPYDAFFALAGKATPSIRPHWGSRAPRA